MTVNPVFSPAPSQALPVRRPDGLAMFPFVLGLTAGLVLAALVALYVTQAPVPFVDRGIQRPQGMTSGTPFQDPPAAAQKPLMGPPGSAGASADDFDRPPATKPSSTTLPAGSGASGSPPTKAPASTAGTSPAQPAMGSGEAPSAASASQFFLQVAAFKSSEEADQMRARLAFMGFEAQILEAKRDNLLLYRVRLGPYRTFEELNRAKTSLSDNGLESTVVRSPQ